MEITSYKLFNVKAEHQKEIIEGVLRPLTWHLFHKDTAWPMGIVFRRTDKYLFMPFGSSQQFDQETMEEIIDFIKYLTDQRQ